MNVAWVSGNIDSEMWEMERIKLSILLIPFCFSPRVSGVQALRGGFGGGGWGESWGGGAERVFPVSFPAVIAASKFIFNQIRAQRALPPPPLLPLSDFLSSKYLSFISRVFVKLRTITMAQLNFAAYISGELPLRMNDKGILILKSS